MFYSTPRARRRDRVLLLQNIARPRSAKFPDEENPGVPRAITVGYTRLRRWVTFSKSALSFAYRSEWRSASPPESRPSEISAKLARAKRARARKAQVKRFTSGENLSRGSSRSHDRDLQPDDENLLGFFPLARTTNHLRSRQGTKQILFLTGSYLTLIARN